MRVRLRSAALALIVALSIAWLTSDNAFGRQDCVTGFNPATLTIPAAGTTVTAPATFSVLSPGDCVWMWDRTLFPDGTFVTGTPTWLNFPSQFAGTGPANISFSSVWPNHEATPRTVTLFFGTRSLPVTQVANPCPLTLLPLGPINMPANGGTRSFTVTTSGSSCSYATHPSDGVTIVSGATGSTFPATVTFSVPPNTDEYPMNRAVQVSSVGTALFAPGLWITQAGTPITTDEPANGLLFVVHRGGSGAPHITAPEPLTIANTEDPTASWTAATNEPWLVVAPGSGVSPATTLVSIDPAAAAALSAGYYSGTMALTSSIAPGTPNRVAVGLWITDAASSTRSPWGVLDIPVQGATGLSGAVPVGGWAVDDVGIRRVQIFRGPVAGEPSGEVYLGDATRVRGARPDIAYTQPEARRAGWGFMLLSNVLPGGGNGTFDLMAYAEDIEGHRTPLGRKTVTFDNTHSAFPFGTIDVPSQGGSITGTAPIQGWVLAQPGKLIPFDGSTIRLTVDGALLPQAAAYGFARPDVASFFPFPTYTNGNGPAAQFVVDTTALANGLHTMAWVAVDDQGVVEGIGSRYFTVDNGPASQVTAADAARSARAVRALPQAPALVWNRQGFDDRQWALQWAGARTTELRQPPGERLEVALDSWWWPAGCGPYSGYLLTGDVAGPLPPGASLDGEQGVFSWLPPPGFGGTFELVFVRRACTGREERIPLRVIIQPR